MTHLSDGALLLVHDGETWGLRTDEMQQHLRGCLACRTRLEEIRETLSFVSRVLSEADIVVPKTRRKPTPQMMAAAAAAILVTVSVWLTPVAGWVARYSHSIWGAEEPDVVGSTEAFEVSAPLSSSAGAVSFVPTDSVFLLEVESWQLGGELTIRIGEYDAATATVTGSLEQDNLLVLPSGLRIMNVPSTTNEYLILLPASIARVDLNLPDALSISLEHTTVTKEWSIPLIER